MTPPRGPPGRRVGRHHGNLVSHGDQKKTYITPRPKTPKHQQTMPERSNKNKADPGGTAETEVTRQRMAAHKRDKHCPSNPDKRTGLRSKQIVKKSTDNWVTISHSTYLLFRRVVIVLLAGVSALAHNYHVSTLFENDRHFSHLSTLEREMTFRSEMGMYYSYYKTIVEAPSFLDGVNEITNNNLTEYPSIINALERFNLMPEIILGGSFRIFDRAFKALGIVGKQCWRVDRGQGLDPVDSCEGIQQPEYFYLEAVWFCAGITASVIFLYGVFLSDSVLGGIIAVMCFFFNHGECTRVQWTPPLRESFAYPFCLLQMLCVSVFIGHNQGTIDDTLPSARHKFQVVAVAITSCICLTLWQFSQFVLATQVIAFLMMFVCGFISRFSILLILTGQACAVAITLLIMFGNELLLSSLLTCLLLSSILTLFFFYPIIRVCDRFQIHKFLSVLVIALGTIVLKTRAFTSNHDAHILNILKSKFSSFRDFHTLLYTCSAEFDFLGRETVRKLTITWLLPAVLGIFLILFIRCCLIEDKIPIDSQIVYNALQFGAFAIMAVLIMRLKLFFTPHLCIIASLIASEKYILMIKSKEIYYGLLIVFIGAMSVIGFGNISDQYSIIGEYSNIGLEELLVWINNNTPSTAVFAGPMPVTAAILLSTRRPIVNHPHYEDALLRERTKKVYSAFSRKPPEEIYETLSSLYVNYLVLSDNWCFSHGRPGCRMVDLWDHEDPANANRSPTCPQLFVGSAFPFNRVFSNNEYAVLSLQPPYVELKGFNKY